MSDDACPLPTDPTPTERSVMDRLMAARTIAVVGLSDDPSRASHRVAAFLQKNGRRIIPVNPNCSQVLGEPCYPSLSAISERVDLVDVFRRPEHCPQVTRDAIAIGAGGVWLQSGIVSPESQRLAQEANLDFIQDRCLMVELVRHASAGG